MASGPEIPRFAQGDTVGLVINIKEKTGYLVKNGTTVCKVVYSSNNPEQITFALHLGVGDEICICSEEGPADPAQYASDSVLILQTERGGESTGL